MSTIDTARRILALSAAATEGPWTATHDTPHPGACVSYVGDVWWVHGTGGRRGAPDDDAALIAESRAGAEELARFVLLVDGVTRAEAAVGLAAGRENEPLNIAYRTAVAVIRRRLGLPGVP